MRASCSKSVTFLSRSAFATDIKISVFSYVIINSLTYSFLCQSTVSINWIPVETEASLFDLICKLILLRSYIDVYKRQFPWNLLSEPSQKSYVHKCVCVFWFTGVRLWSSAANAAVLSVAVSYTHLDVYKRQPQYCGH